MWVFRRRADCERQLRVMKAHGCAPVSVSPFSSRIAARQVRGGSVHRATHRAVDAALHMCGALLLIVAVTRPALAQPAAELSGRLYNSATGAPVDGAVVVLEELARETRSDPTGGFTFDSVPAGEYHIGVRAGGYSSRRTEVRVGTASVHVDVFVDPELHFQEVVSVSPGARSQFDTYQPTSVLAGQELTKALELSLGETLEDQPSIAVRSFGPASARPVIRGLDGDRVLILEDGQRTGDLSSQSGDHGVIVNPAAAERIEVVRGPATLLYGTNAIGGLVNVITDNIPVSPQRGVSGRALLDVGSAATQAAGAADLHVGNGRVALHAAGGGQRAGDVQTPEGAVQNSHLRSGFGSVGVAWTGERGYAGGSYAYDETGHGVPVVHEGTVQLAPRRHALTARAGAAPATGLFESWRASMGHRRFRHEERQAGELATLFRNDTTEVELRGTHRAAGRLVGTFGGWLLDRAFEATGEDAIAPRVHQRGFALFLFEEVAWPHVTVQFGARADHTRFSPAGEQRRTFTTASFSGGVLYRPQAADDALTVAVSVARAARTPALEELFFFGPHHGNFAFEVGDPALGPETALGLDVSLRWRSARTSGELTYFRNDIRDFIFRRPLTEEEFESREPAFEARFPGRGSEHDHGAGEEELQLIEHVGADARLQGFEAHADVLITPTIVGQLGYDYVRGTLQENDQPLPRMPPSRVRGGVRYQQPPFQAGGEVVHALDQDRVFGAETRTPGFTRLDLFAAYSFVGGGATHTVTARVDNATDALYRNHLSFTKDLVPEMGRNVKLLWAVEF